MVTSHAGSARRFPVRLGLAKTPVPNLDHPPITPEATTHGIRRATLPEKQFSLSRRLPEGDATSARLGYASGLPPSLAAGISGTRMDHAVAFKVGGIGLLRCQPAILPRLTILVPLLCQGPSKIVWFSVPRKCGLDSDSKLIMN
jgi:hypothetical protein